MTQAQELAAWLRMVADQGDMGRKPYKDDKKRIAADLLESQAVEIERLQEALTSAKIWHEDQRKSISKQPNSTTGHLGWMKAEHDEQASNLGEALGEATPGQID